MGVVFQDNIIRELQEKYPLFTHRSIRYMLTSYISRMIKELYKDEHICVNGRTKGGQWNGFIILEDVNGNGYIKKMKERKRKKIIREKVYRHYKNKRGYAKEKDTK